MHGERLMAAEARVNIRAKVDTKQIGRLKRSLTGLRKTVLNLKTASVALGGAAGMGLIIRAGLKQIDVIGKMARLYRTSTEDIGAMTLAARVGGAELDTFLKAARNASRQMFDFSRGTGEAKDAMEEMGVTVEDIKPLMNDQVALMGFLAGKVNEVENSVDRLAIAQDIFGGRATVVLNVLENGTETVAAFRAEAALLGGALSQDAVQGVEAANDSFTRLGFLLEGMRNQTVAALAPAIQASVDTFKEWILEITNAEGGVKSFALNMAVSILRSVKDIIGGFRTFLDTIDSVREKLVGIGALEEDNSKKEIAAQRIRIENLVRSITVYERFNTKSEVYNELLASREAAYKRLNELQNGNNSLLDAANEKIDTLIAKTLERKLIEGAGGGGGADSGSGISDVKAQEKALEGVRTFLASKVEIIAQGQLTQDERAMEAFGRQQLMLDESLAREIISRERHAELTVGIDEQTALHRIAQEKKTSDVINSMRASVVGNAASLLQVLGAKNKVFAIASIALTKGMAIAQTLAHTQTAAVLAYSSQLIPGDPTSYPRAAAAYLKTEALGNASAAIIGAVGLVQAASVGSGGASSGSPANPINTTQQRPLSQQQSTTQIVEHRITIDWEGGSPDQVDQLARSLSKNMANGGESPVAA